MISEELVDAFVQAAWGTDDPPALEALKRRDVRKGLEATVEQVGWRRPNREWNVWDYWTPERVFDLPPAGEGWERVFVAKDGTPPAAPSTGSPT